MRRSGEMVLWNDERGFGFIRDADGTRRFVHISAIKRASIRPQPGDRVIYTAATGEDGRPVARSVVLFDATPAPAPPRRRQLGSATSGVALRLAFAAAIVGLALFAALAERVPAWLPAAYLGLGVVSIVAYWLDKRAAEARRWRTREASLHLLDFVGGIAGGLAAQALLRHKNRKPGFAITTWTIASAHSLALATLTTGLLDYLA